jgi:DNA helicase-2/ATP-dependent DNA helicase PcrA
MNFTEGLNDAQKKAVETIDGPLLIVAGAGAGKTKTIVHRICYLVTKGVSPSSILAVTFTNKAAKEMLERTKTLIEKVPSIVREDSLPFISTFHSLGVYLLRKFGAYGGKVKRFTILDDGDSLALIKESLLAFGLDPKENEPRLIRSIISRNMNALTDREDLENSANPKQRIAGRVWTKYKSLKESQNALDFDDLLIQTLDMLENNKEVRDWCNTRWSHIHIDEYQDTNEVQYKIAKALAGDSKNICVVGDSDQSIYSWRGANIKNILEFEKDFKDASVVLLEENYRSTKNIISSANKVITKNSHRTPKTLFTNNDNGEKISIYGAYDEIDEANFIVERCVEHIDNGTKADDIAVLFRTNFQSRVLEEAFLSYSIPYQVLGVKFFERKEVKDVVSYIRASINPESLLDIKRIINVPTRGIGKTTVATLFAEGKGSLTGKALVNVTNFYDLLDRIREYIKTNKTTDVIKFIIKESGLENFYKESPDGEERMENLEELVTLGLRYDNFANGEGIEKLVEEATLASDQDNLAEAKGVKLMTIHSAKGLEFSTVFVAGLEQGLFPHERDSKLTGAEGEEERRLMYVALTRARHKLYLSYASMRTIYGSRDFRLPSEFLLDIPEELVTRESREGEAGFGSTIYI